MYLESDFGNSDQFGVDPSPSLGIMPEDDTTNVEVHNVVIDNDVSVKRILDAEFDPVIDDGNFGIDHFQYIRKRVLEILSP